MAAFLAIFFRDTFISLYSKHFLCRYRFFSAFIRQNLSGIAMFSAARNLAALLGFTGAFGERVGPKDQKAVDWVFVTKHRLV